MLVTERDTGREFAMPSDLTLVFSGARPNPLPIATNAYGQVLADGEPLEHVFAAGDCAHFQGGGANTLSAQVAVRKGGTVAGNLLSQVHADQKMQPYRYRERGYFVSLGPLDGIGWLGDERHVLTGIRAFAVKAMVDAQLDLLLDGIDTYRV